MAVRDEKGWTWGGVLKGAATIVGAAIVSFVVWTGAAMAVGAATGNLAAGSTAAWMVGAGETGIQNAAGALGNIWDIPSKFAGAVSGAMWGTVDVATKAAQTNVVEPVTEALTGVKDKAIDLGGQAYDGASGLVSEYGKPAAAVAGAGAVGYWAGKVGGRKEQAQSFRDQVTKGREQAALADLGRA